MSKASQAVFDYAKANVMRGALYNSTSIGQIAAHKITHNAIARAALNVSRMPRSEWTVVEIFDLGCGAGASALDVCSRVVSDIRANGVANPIRYGFIDLFENNWGSLMNTLHGNPECSPLHYVFPFTQPGDFYARCAPPRSVDLHLSMIALHWMAGPPLEPEASLATTPFLFAQEPAVPEQVTSLWANKAEADLTRFLRFRAEELRPGCEAILLMVGGEGPQEWLARGSDRASVLRQALWRAYDAGDVDEAAATRAFVSVYFRSAADVRAAVAAVPQLELVEVATTTIPIAEGLGAASGAMCDLAWSIFGASMEATSGLSEAQLERIRHHLSEVLDERFLPDEGALHTYVMAAVRRRNDPEDVLREGLWD